MQQAASSTAQPRRPIFKAFTVSHMTRLLGIIAKLLVILIRTEFYK